MRKKNFITRHEWEDMVKLFHQGGTFVEVGRVGGISSTKARMLLITAGMQREKKPGRQKIMCPYDPSSLPKLPTVSASPSPSPLLEDRDYNGSPDPRTALLTELGLSLSNMSKIRL